MHNRPNEKKLSCFKDRRKSENWCGGQFEQTPRCVGNRCRSLESSVSRNMCSQSRSSHIVCRHLPSFWCMKLRVVTPQSRSGVVDVEFDEVATQNGTPRSRDPLSTKCQQKQLRVCHTSFGCVQLTRHATAAVCLRARALFRDTWSEHQHLWTSLSSGCWVPTRLF